MANTASDVVLDHQQRAARGGLADQFDARAASARFMPAVRLVEQQGMRAARERNAEIERALLGITLSVAAL